MRLVIDTDVFIDYFRGVEKARSCIEGLKKAGVVCFSAITEAELLSGDECADEGKRDIIIDSMVGFVKIPVDNEIAQLGGSLRRKFKMGLDDALIAATAKKMKARLVTRNLRDFRRVEGLEVTSPY